MVIYKKKFFAVPPPLPATTPPPMMKPMTPPPTTPAMTATSGKPGIGGKLKSIFSGKTAGKVGTAAMFVGIPAIGMIQTHKAMKESKEQSKEQVSAMKEQTDAINERTEEIKKQTKTDSESDSDDSKLKTKKFAWPLLASLAMGGAQMAQSAKQGKEAEAMNKQQLKAQAKATKATEKQNQLLEEIKNKEDMSAQEKQEKAVMLLQKTESEPCSILQREFAFNWGAAKSIGRDLFKASKAAGINSSIKGTLKTTAGITAAGYVVNKAIQRDMKKNGLDVDKSGNLVQKQPQIKQQRAYSIMGAAMTLGFEAPRYLSYKAEKKQLKNQIAATDQPSQKVVRPKSVMDGQKRVPQRQFSVMGGIKSIPGNLKSGWNTFNSHRGQTITGGLMKAGSFGQFGTKNVQAFGRNLKLRSNNPYLNKAGQWIYNHKTAANVAALAPAVAIGSTLFTKSQKAMRKGMEKIDPNAYKYQKAKEQAAEDQKNAQRAQMG